MNYTAQELNEIIMEAGIVAAPWTAVKSDTECLPTSKQIEEDCRGMLFSELPIEEREVSYIFTPERLKAYKEALCREQRELCADEASKVKTGGYSGSGESQMVYRSRDTEKEKRSGRR